MSRPRRPRVGFLGVGWIGLDRMRAMLASGHVEAAAFVEPNEQAAAAAAAVAPGARRLNDLASLLGESLDGVAIATPSALHADQAIALLNAGASVFCQKPLGRDAVETRRVVEAARRADRLLRVDLSYRTTDAARRMAAVLCTGDLGPIFFADLAFHNAFGPDKPWFQDKALSGGGCLIDLGVHLVDLAMWLLNFPEATVASATLRRAGARLPDDGHAVEDFAAATLSLADGGMVRIACSWRLHAGRPAEIGAALYGPSGGVAMGNVDGSFHDFAASRFARTEHWPLAAPPDAWGGRAAADWAARLAAGERFDSSAEQFVRVAEILDAIRAIGIA